jgi:4-hydroxy-3-polyprenylbenzoate decarboxylase
MIDEMIFAGYLKKRPVELVKCVTSDLYVPAHAEFILEGYVDLDELRLEGPFGDHTGYYSLSDMYPVFHLEKMTHKKNPVYPTTIVGKPPMEDCYLGKATERIFLPLMKVQCPELVDLDFPLEGVFHNCAIVSIRKAFPLHGNKILYALWGLGQMMYTKMIIIVDQTVNVHDYKAVAQSILQNVTTDSHLVITEGPLDALDHASNRPFQGFRLGIDATTKLPLEASGINIQGNPQLKIMPFDKKSGSRALEFLAAVSDDIEKPNWIVLIDDWIDPSHISTVAWKIFNNIDPKRDMVIKMRQDGSLFVGIDATKKGPEDGLMRPWPDDIEMSPEIIDKVNERWSLYGISLDS